MRTLLIVHLMVALLALGCIESNPQPSPIGGQDKNGGYDPTSVDSASGFSDLSVADMVGEIVPTPVDAATEDAPASDAPAEDAATEDAATEDAPAPDATAMDIVELFHPVDQGCCGADLLCPADAICVTEGAEGGTCIEQAPAGQCWQDSDCAVGMACVGAVLCPCDADCMGLNTPGVCKTYGVAQCIEKHSGCECYEGCADGFTTFVYYPTDAGDFPEDISPSEELLNVAVAMYDCSVCVCGEGWQLKIDGDWVDVDVLTFCDFLDASDGQCSGCLSQWTGGCC